jgi:hypothetical protein
VGRVVLEMTVISGEILEAYTAVIVHESLKGYALPIRGSHGVVHWARVLENGLRLVSATGANLEVVTLFALFHDSRRANEFHDEGHGLRGGEYARALRGTLVHLRDSEFELLFEACRLHTDGQTQGELTVKKHSRIESVCGAWLHSFLRPSAIGPGRCEQCRAVRAGEWPESRGIPKYRDTLPRFGPRR